MPSAWITHCTAYYQNRKKTDPTYRYTSALRDCRPTYLSTADNGPNSSCHRVKLSNCRRRTKCKVTVKGKRKSYCRMKKNKSRRVKI